MVSLKNCVKSTEMPRGVIDSVTALGELVARYLTVTSALRSIGIVAAAGLYSKPRNTLRYTGVWLPIVPPGKKPICVTV